MGRALPKQLARQASNMSVHNKQSSRRSVMSGRISVLNKQPLTKALNKQSSSKSISHGRISRRMSAPPQELLSPEIACYIDIVFILHFIFMG